jgi:hypothetical protein
LTAARQAGALPDMAPFCVKTQLGVEF